MAHGFLLHARYESGFELTERTNHDFSPYDAGRNVFNAILTQAPTEHGHGRLVTLACLPESGTGDSFVIDWTKFWQYPDAMPIYYREMSRVVEGADEGLTHCDGHYFGLKYTGDDGRLVTDVMRIGDDGPTLVQAAFADQAPLMSVAAPEVRELTTGS